MEERDPMTHGGHGAPGRPAAEAGQTVPGTPGAPQPDGTVPPPGGGAQRRRLGGRVRFWLLTLAAATAGVTAVLVGLA
ncbi:MAG: hypothetical protein J2P34_12550, partial [Actinobacteria bacterium]|nr:hypothetical protein [Actinomycetota bacterium]